MTRRAMHIMYLMYVPNGAPTEIPPHLVSIRSGISGGVHSGNVHDVHDLHTTHAGRLP